MGFTRDGRFFYAESEAASDIYQVKLDPQTGKITGSPEKLISRYEGLNLSPSYSPDGTGIIFLRRDMKRDLVRIVNRTAYGQSTRTRHRAILF